MMGCNRRVLTGKLTTPAAARQRTAAVHNNHPSKAVPAEQHTRRMHSDLGAPIVVALAALEPATDQAHRVGRCR